MANSAKPVGALRRIIPWAMLVILLLLTAGALVLGVHDYQGAITVNQLKAQLLVPTQLGSHWNENHLGVASVTSDDWDSSPCPSGVGTFGGPAVAITYTNQTNKDLFTEQLYVSPVSWSRFIHSFESCPGIGLHAVAYARFARSSTFRRIGDDSFGLVRRFDVGGVGYTAAVVLVQERSELMDILYGGNGSLSEVRRVAILAAAKVSGN